jgi:ankyrin repeat protein
LLQEKEVRIGKEPVLSAGSGYNEKYYIDRTFNHNIVIRQDILTDKHEGKFTDLLASSETEFKELCQQHPKKNVHWLKQKKSGELIWHQSQGNLQTLRKYIDKQKSHCYAPSDLDKLLQQAKQQRVTVIADKAGMGKSTVLTYLSKQIEQKCPAHWLVRVDLNDYSELLKANEGKQMDKMWVLEFVSKKVLKLETHLEKELFKKAVEGNEVSKVVIMVDGFDEVCPKYKEIVLDMLQVLKQTSLEQLWVTTRPHLSEELEDKLQQLSYTLHPFSEDEQFEFLKKFWHETLNLEDTNQQQFEIYATALIRKLAQSISDKDNDFTGVPLQTCMLAEAFEEEFRSFYLSHSTQPELPRKLDLLGLYRRFIDRKYDICYQEKSKTAAGNLAAENQQKIYFKWMQEQHQRLALQVLFTDDQVTFLQIDHDSNEGLAMIGIVQRNNEGELHFIHRTFAEYYVAEFLMNQLTEKIEQYTQVQEVLLNKVLLRTEFQVTRFFLNGLLENGQPSREVLQEYGRKLDEQWNAIDINRPSIGFTSALHTAALEDNACIIGFLFDSLKSGEYSNTLTKVLFLQDIFGQTAWHLAAETNSVQALKRIQEWADAVTPNLTYNLLLSQDKDKRTTWQLAAEGGHIDMVVKMWGWAKEAQTNPSELQNKLLLAQDSEGRTAWHVAVKRGSLDVIGKLWGWAKEELSSPTLLKNKLFQSRDKHGVSAWHIAASTGSVQILDKLWVWAKELQLKPEELRNELLSKDESGQTAWHMAAEGGHVEVLEKLWGWAKEESLNTDYLKIPLFLPEDSCEFSTWCLAVNNGHIHVL